MVESEAELAEYVLRDKGKLEKPEDPEQAKKKAVLQTIVFIVALLVFIVILGFIFVYNFEFVWPF